MYFYPFAKRSTVCTFTRLRKEHVCTFTRFRKGTTKKTGGPMAACLISKRGLY